MKRLEKMKGIVVQTSKLFVEVRLAGLTSRMDVKRMWQTM
jgi:hypothetical protein